MTIIFRCKVISYRQPLYNPRRKIYQPYGWVIYNVRIVETSHCHVMLNFLFTVAGCNVLCHYHDGCVINTGFYNVEMLLNRLGMTELTFITTTEQIKTLVDNVCYEHWWHGDPVCSFVDQNIYIRMAWLWLLLNDRDLEIWRVFTLPGD